MPVDFYELLGVERDAETSEIKQAFRRKAREYHPDVNDDERATAQFTVVRKAYEVLTDDAERADYDRMGHRSYVNKRLDGLTKFKYPGQTDEASGDASTSSSRSATSGGGRRTGSSSGSSTRSSSSRTSSSGSTSSRSSSTRSGSSSRTGSSRSSSARSGSSSRTGSSSGASTRSSTSRTSSAGRSSRTDRSSTSGSSGSARSSNRGGRRSNRSGGANGADRYARESGRRGAAAGARTNPLWYGWGLSLAALLAYLAALGWYVSVAGGEFVAVLSSLGTADPAQTLLSSSPLALPTVAAIQTAAAPTTLVLPAAAALLAVTVGAVVGRFGHAWTTWLYALGAAAPVAVVVAGALGVPRPVGVDLLALAVLPLAGAGGFVVDVGRYLFAAR